MACKRLCVIVSQVYVADVDTGMGPDEYDAVTPYDAWPAIDPKTNGMYADGTHLRSSSFTVEGGKFRSINWPDRVMLVASTPASNASSRAAGGQRSSRWMYGHHGV